MGSGIPDLELAAFTLQPWDGLVPGADLLGGGVGDELLELEPDHPGFRAGEVREAGLPAIAVVGGGIVHDRPNSPAVARPSHYTRASDNVLPTRSRCHMRSRMARGRMIGLAVCELDIEDSNGADARREPLFVKLSRAEIPRLCDLPTRT